ncbi:M1 family metallopeptidase [Metabacillus sp. GX 13764]|uniref:M1 family metallopeptidase n=1 Tax=Metabacillus kandeliae TaxID=2900151 RepID=UPI001E4EAD11|nr:M1 family metallopeptidase [Metabacillus kandeliae]MCD7034824.1 M1 family metallopeptidase [Metabacillus kandeliae]
MKERHLKALVSGIAAVMLTAGIAMPAQAKQESYSSSKAAYKAVNQKAQKKLVSLKSARKSEGTADSSLRGPADPSYKMDVKYDAKTHKLTGKLNVSFKNNVKQNLSELYFNLWGRAADFKEKGGGMDVSNIRVNGKKAAFDVKETALHITNLSLPKNKKATVTMDFTVSFPEQQDRFGWYGDTVSMGNWFPILSVYDEEGWNVDPYFNAGESFYSLTGNFDVNVTTNRKQVIAATGTEQGKPKMDGELATHHYIAENVRDFAMEMNPTYKILSSKVNGVKVHVYYDDKYAKYAASLLESGKDSIKLFSKKFGKYPWPELDVVTMEGWFGGMEYPQLVMISLNENRKQEWVKSVNAHEIGHQWFYGIIGDNEYDEPWLDESFASFAAALYDNSLDELNVPPLSDPYYHISSKVSDFTARGNAGISAYYYTIYDYGSTALNDLRLELGDAAFYKAMKAYFKEKKFGISTTKDFISAMERSSKQDLSPFFRAHRIFPSDQN